MVNECLTYKKLQSHVQVAVTFAFLQCLREPSYPCPSSVDIVSCVEDFFFFFDQSSVCGFTCIFQ